MASTRKSKSPEGRIGIYKKIEDVPNRYRLRNHDAAYADRDVWSEFKSSITYDFDSDHYQATFRRVNQSWKEHMEGRNRHHALARPDDVERWCSQLAETRTLGTVWKEYWVRLEQFYSWLYFHTEHPHVYHPVLMAAVSYETSGEIWELKMASRDRGGDADE